MKASDVMEAELTFDTAYVHERAMEGFPLAPRSTEDEKADQIRCAHLLRTDPGGSWVAQDKLSGQIVGVAQALIRDSLWVLAILGVLPPYQERGVGKSLLDRTLAYGDRSERGLIQSTGDSRALHRYVHAGFELHPAVSARGIPQTPIPDVDVEIVVGNVKDLQFVSRIDDRIRGARRATDIELLLELGCELLIGMDGYAVVNKGKILTLGALTDQAAEKLLQNVLARCRDKCTVQVSWITSHQQWAIRVVTAAGLRLQSHGAVMARGWGEIPTSYLPNGMSG